MAITAVLEKDSGSDNSGTFPYYVHEDTGALTAAAAVTAAQTQSVIDNVGTITNHQYKRISANLYRVTLLNRALSVSNLTPAAVGSVEVGFDFAMGPIERRVGLSRVNVYGEAATGDFGGAINVPSSNRLDDALGVRLPPPPQKFWLRWTGAASQLSSTYTKTVAGLMGTVNNATYRTYAAGTLCLVRASGSLRDDDSASLYFGWAYQPNVTGESWGSFSIGYQGFEYPWARSRNGLLGNAGEKFLAPKINAVYVEQILPTGNHGGLGLPP